MNKRILSVFVFSAALFSMQAQDGKGGISETMLNQIKQSYQGTTADKALRNAIGNNDIRKLALNQENLTGMDTHFSVKVNSKGITDQKSSGRCWLFTGLNVMRAKTIAKYDFQSFEFSEIYPFFWDQLEKANLFLQGVIDTREKPMDDKMVEWLFRNPLSDGGTFTGVADIVSKYGLVPKEVMPELDILYMTRVQKERFLDEEEFNRVKDSFVLDPSKLRTAKPDMIVLHPLPRVNEITRAVDNDPRVAYFRQVENGKFVRMALIYTLLKWAEGEKLAAVPDLAEGMFIDRSMKCPNSRCISATEDVDPLFVKAGDTCRCAYCEAKIR